MSILQGTSAVYLQDAGADVNAEMAKRGVLWVSEYSQTGPNTYRLGFSPGPKIIDHRRAPTAAVWEILGKAQEADFTSAFNTSADYKIGYEEGNILEIVLRETTSAEVQTTLYLTVVKNTVKIFPTEWEFLTVLPLFEGPLIAYVALVPYLL